MDTWLGIYESLTKKVGGREKQRQLGTVETNTIEKNWGMILRMLKMIGSTWREAHRLEKSWHDNLSDQEGLVLP